nr:extracellular solute-binding protein [Cohnella sp. WQ 127256]
MVLMILVLLTGVLAACGGKSNNNGTSPAAANTVSPSSNEGTVAEEKKPEDYKGEITIWSFNNGYFEERVADFKTVYPNVKVNLVNINWGDYLTKFETTKASGGELPDVAIGESYWWGKMLAFKDTFVDLNTLGFSKDDLVSSVSEVVVNQQGKFVAIPEGLGIGAIWYRKDLAKKYFGTDNSSELSAKFPTWDEFINAGEDLKQQSGGEVFLLSNSQDAVEALLGSLKTNGKSYVNGNKLTIKENSAPAFALIEKALKNGAIGKLDGPAADAAWSNGKVVFFPSAGWRESYIPTVDKEGSGQWGVMLPPGGSYFRGGSAEFIVDKKDPNKAELAALFIKQSLYTDQGMELNNKHGNLSALKAIQDRKQSNGVNPFYGEDLTLLFYDWSTKIPPARYGPYDSVIEDALKMQANAMMKANISADKAIDNAISEIKQKTSDLQ